MDVRPAPAAPKPAPKPAPNLAPHRALRRLGAMVVSVALLAACGGATPKTPKDPLRVMQEAAARSSDGEVVGRWLLGELVAPGGDPARAKLARRQLESIQPAAKGMFASIARAIDDEAHGKNKSAAEAHLDALTAARGSSHPDAQLIAWFSANHLLSLRASVSGLWEKARSRVEATIQQPGSVGWRARGELVGWWSLDAFRGKALPSEDPLFAATWGTSGASGASGGSSASSEPGRGGLPSAVEAAAALNGCVKKARLAGPFGHGSPEDSRRHFEAERAGPWPLTFPRDPRQREAPRVLPVEHIGCLLRSTEPAGSGMFYVETFVDLPASRDVIVSAQGALAIFVDDVEVFTRDTRQWGVWPRFGARVRLSGGRHRILARVGSSETSIRLLDPSGGPLDGVASDDPAPPYALTPPERLPDPNVLEPFMTALGVPPQRGTPPSPARDTNDPIARYLAAYLAHVEGQQDVSSVLLEPLITDPARATGLALAAQAVYVDDDPIFAPTLARDLMTDLRARAAAKDTELWWPRFWLALDEADKVGVPEVAPKLTELATHFPEVSEIWKGLSIVYGRIGWKVEHARAVKDAAARFPDDVEALRDLLRLYTDQGYVTEADKVADRIREIDPNAEVDIERAIERRDYSAALKELARIGARRADRKDIAIRVADLLTRAGVSGESIEKLEAALKKRPDDAGARLALADARFARGDRGALQRSLVEAIEKGADDGAIRDAIELLDGTTELSPFRRDAMKTIAEFERSGQTMPGTAARVLDYSAIWVHPDGSARMLEHEVICIQSPEAIAEHAEQRIPRGLALKIRTIKRDGRTFEPEFVDGKPTVTMPHLEVGDYIETETLTTLRGDGEGGLVFQGPRWFFREEKLSYWRSEFVVVSPKSRPLQVETGGDVPPPDVTESGALVTRRWRVDKSPALPEEVGSAPIQEFLPNVRIGWGISLDRTLAHMVDATSDETPRDPRIARIAQAIVNDAPPSDGLPIQQRDPSGKGATGDDAEASSKASSASGDRGKPSLSIDEKARRIYRWVLANIETGRDANRDLDPRRVVVGKSGNRTAAFVYLCRLLGLDVSMAAVRDRLTAPPVGPFSEAEMFSTFVVRLTTESGPRYMVVWDKYAPYGYLPSSLRGQPVVVLRPGAPRETTSAVGSRDGDTYEGTVELSADGSASIELEQRYEGKLAIGLRSGLESLPDARLKDTIEAKLLPSELPGARLLSLEVKNLADLDAPLILQMKIRVQNFAQVRGGELVIAAPLSPRVGSLASPLRIGVLASLAARETPLYIAEQMSTRTSVRLRVILPEGAHITSDLTPLSLREEGRVVTVSDRAEGGALVYERLFELPAGRVKPEAYPAFQDFLRRADSALNRDVIVTLRSATPER